MTADSTFYKLGLDDYPKLAETCIVLVGFTNYCEETLSEVNISSDLRDTLAHINSIRLTENFIFDEFFGYSNLQKYLLYEATPLVKWTNLDLIRGFYDRIEDIVSSDNYDLNNVYIKDCIRLVSEQWSPIEYNKYFKIGLELTKPNLEYEC